MSIAFFDFFDGSGFICNDIDNTKAKWYNQCVIHFLKGVLKNMFKSLYRLHQNEGRLLPEAVLTGKGVFVMLLLFFVEQLAAEALALLVNLYELPLGVMEINLIVNGGVLLLMLFFFGGFFWTNLKHFFKDFQMIYLWLPLACYAGTMFLNVIVQMALALIRGEFQNTSNNALIMELLYKYPIPLILLTVIIAPITEEAIFRAALSRSMTASKKPWIKVMGFVLSIFFFAFFHVYQFVFFALDAAGQTYLTFNANELLSILVYLPMAAGLVICSYFSKNFWCSVITHMLSNGIAVAMLLLLWLMAHLPQ